MGRDSLGQGCCDPRPVVLTSHGYLASNPIPAPRDPTVSQSGMHSTQRVAGQKPPPAWAGGTTGRAMSPDLRKPAGLRLRGRVSGQQWDPGGETLRWCWKAMAEKLHLQAEGKGAQDLPCIQTSACHSPSSSVGTHLSQMARSPEAKLALNTQGGEVADRI